MTLQSRPRPVRILLAAALAAVGALVFAAAAGAHAEISPPVDDSATATVSLRALSRAAIFSAWGSSSFMFLAPYR